MLRLFFRPYQTCLFDGCLEPGFRLKHSRHRAAAAAATTAAADVKHDHFYVAAVFESTLMGS